ncbi:hypothetical protein OCU04_011960 [Sclerotinia nivalis]|uniref:Uncharacterized protein n=1 Tax=Sclerotinia nivalis TaxID=352851 RepID=A0A9X0AAB8_9HELO|nr:hypothetical protein OCU04_011960 [Sclerotinia nivalis]
MIGPCHIEISNIGSYTNRMSPVANRIRSHPDFCYFIDQDHLIRRIIFFNPISCCVIDMLHILHIPVSDFFGGRGGGLRSDLLSLAPLPCFVIMQSFNATLS